MVTEAISGLDFSLFSRVLFVCLQEHEDKYVFHQALDREIHQLVNGTERDIPIDTLFLQNPTSSQSETVCHGIKGAEVTGSFLIKDADGYFKPEKLSGRNEICFFDLNNLDNINARAKSYITLDSGGLVTNIVEKKVVSPTFCVGGYGFQDAEAFCASYEKLAKLNSGHEIYVSHVIFDLMVAGHQFQGVNTTEFEDWGTLDAWNNYKSQYQTIFCDIDGTLITNTGSKTHPFLGEGLPIKENIDVINKLYDSGKAFIALTTSRGVDKFDFTKQELAKHGIKHHLLVTGLPHTKRIVINDFAATNPYPSCGAINLPRNANNLSDYLK